MRPKHLVLAALLSTFVALTGCGDDDPPGTGGSGGSGGTGGSGLTGGMGGVGGTGGVGATGGGGTGGVGGSGGTGGIGGSGGTGGTGGSAGTGGTASSRSWSAPETLDTGLDAPTAVSVALDGNGNGFAVWHQDRSLYASRYSATAGWDASPTVIAAQQSPDGFQGADGAFAVAINAGGTALVVYVSTTTETQEFRYRRFQGDSWQGNQFLSTIPEGQVLFGQTGLAIDAAGKAVLAWAQGGAPRSIYASYFSGDSDWTPAQEVDARSGNAATPTVAMSSDGTAVVAWSQFDGVRDRIFSNRNSGSGWAGPEVIQLNATTAILFDLITIPSGILAAWREGGGLGEGPLWWNDYSSQSGWRTAREAGVQVTGNSTGRRQLVSDVQGNILLVYGGFGGSIFANRYEVGGSWSPRETITDAGLFPNLAGSANGFGVVAWAGADVNPRDVRASVYTPGQGWANPEVIEADPAALVSGSRVAMDPSGNALSVRNVRTSPGSVTASRYE